MLLIGTTNPSRFYSVIDGPDFSSLTFPQSLKLKTEDRYLQFEGKVYVKE